MPELALIALLGTFELGGAFRGTGSLACVSRAADAARTGDKSIAATSIYFAVCTSSQIFVPCVSRKKRVPNTSVIAATIIG